MLVPLQVIQVAQVRHAFRYPQDTVHDVATKELEYVQGYGDSFDEAYIPSPGFSPGDTRSGLPDSAMSPEARALIRNADGSASDDGQGPQR
jgi:hypothetical protein